MTYEPPVTDYDYIVENCTCAFCGCNCDDLDYLVKDNHVVAVRHACRLGASKVMEDMDQRLVVPMIRDEDGELMEVDWDTALDKAAEYIANSIRPVFYGWSETSTECMKEGLELGEYIGAVLDNQATICHGPSLQAVQNAGYPIQTLVGKTYFGYPVKLLCGRFLQNGADQKGIEGIYRAANRAARQPAEYGERPGHHADRLYGRRNEAGGILRFGGLLFLPDQQDVRMAGSDRHIDRTEA